MGIWAEARGRSAKDISWARHNGHLPLGRQQQEVRLGKEGGPTYTRSDARLKGHENSGGGVQTSVGRCGSQSPESESRRRDSCFPLHLPLTVLSAVPQPPPGDVCFWWGTAEEGSPLTPGPRAPVTACGLFSSA